MLWSLLLYSIFIFNPSKSYPFRVTGEFSSVQELVRIINHEAYPASPIEAQLINPLTQEYGIRLVQKLDNQGYATRENRFQCSLNYLLGDSSKKFVVRLVENDQSILIGDGSGGVIDIGDIAKFDSEPQGDFTAFNVLLHELYEQYQLQIIDELHPGKITRAQLKRAHLKAIQKESNFYSLTEVRTDGDVGEEYIHIEFTNRIDSSTTHYYAHHRNGNIDRVERVYGINDF
jgi:hypothetical protein